MGRITIRIDPISTVRGREVVIIEYKDGVDESDEVEERDSDSEIVQFKVR